MKLLVKPKHLNLNIYKKNASAFLFGIKGLSSFQTKELTIKELTKIVNKYKNKEIFIAIDKNIFNKDIPYLEYVLDNIKDLNIKGIFFYDLAVLYLVKTKKINIPLIWNQNYLTTNYKTCNFYEKEKVQGVLISSEITTEEIIEIKKNTKLTTFVNIFGYQMMSFSNRKLITNYFKHINKKNLKLNNYMIERDTKYLIKENKSGTMIVSNYILNGYNELDKLKDIDYVILNEFMISSIKFNKALSIFNNKIKNNSKGDINSLFNNLSDGFFNKKTIYKVKR